MDKNFIFDRNGIDKSLFVKGVNSSGKVIETSYEPASVAQIQEFESQYQCKLPEQYSQFLQVYNGGVIHPDKVCEYVAVDILESVNGNTLEIDSVGVDFFLTLDRESLSELDEGGADQSWLARTFYLPEAHRFYINDYASLKETLGLELQKFIYIMNSPSPSLIVALACGGELENKILVIDSSIIPEKPLDNVGILANSFDEFLLSLYCEDL